MWITPRTGFDGQVFQSPNRESRVLAVRVNRPPLSELNGRPDAGTGAWVPRRED
jgi:hypothetical protein